MSKRDLPVRRVEQAIGDDAPEIIEDYPDDERGPACLILGMADLAMILHIVVGYGGDRPEVVTAYEPDPREWINYRRRR